MRPHESHFFNFIIIINIGIIILLFGILIIQPELTGKAVITAEGGKISNLNLKGNIQALSWSIIYGNFSNISSTFQLELYGGEVKGLRVNVDEDLEEIFVLASSRQYIDIRQIEPANLSFLDQYLNLSAESEMSATNTFTKLENYTINNNTYKAWTLNTNAIYGNYTQALFKIGEDPLIIAKKTINATGFNNQSSDFQLMLPIKKNEINKYYFNTFPSFSDLNCSLGFNLSIEMINNYSDLYFEWEEILGAESYNILYIENFTEQNENENYSFDFNTNKNITGIGSLNYTIPNIIKERKERVFTIQAMSKNQICDTDEKVGLFHMNLTKLPDEPLNLVSKPFIYENMSVSEYLEPIRDDLEIAYLIDPITQAWFIYYPEFGIDNIEHKIQETEALLIEVKKDTTLPITGKFRNSTEFELYEEYNLHGFHPIMGNREFSKITEPIYPLLADYGTFRYNNENKQFELFFVMRNQDVWTILINDIDKINVFEGFIIYSNGPGNFSVK
jgi:hypothetical protein